MMIFENRLTLEEFIVKYLRDIEALEQVGFSTHDAQLLVGRLAYVANWCDTPDFVEVVKKLPNNLKWSDGETYKLKAGKRNDGETYTFLIDRDDLYFRGGIGAVVFPKDYVPSRDYKKISSNYRNKIYLIKDFRRYTIIYLVTKMQAGISQYFETAITDFLHKNGCRSGDTRQTLRKLGKPLEDLVYINPVNPDGTPMDYKTHK